jgi:uncharacterized membrane protein
MWGAWGLGMMVMMLVFWGLVIVGVVLAIKWLAGQGEGSRADRALESSARGTREARSTRTNSKRRGAIFAEDDGDA